MAIPLVFAIALFSHMYGVSCQKCHTVIPHLNEFGAHFMASGDRIPGVQPGQAFPVAVKFNLVVSSENQGSGANGAGLPKAIVDEIEVFTAGAIGTRASYFVEQYAVDGGEHGLLRDAWVSDRLNPWDARVPLYLQAGSYTLPLPVDPETFRETYQNYAIFSQTIGNNPFNFFDPKVGAQVTVGDTLRGVSLRFFAGPGYDRVSGLPKTGIDTMFTLADAMGPLTPSFYHYEGERPEVDGEIDRFSRTGYATTFTSGKLAVDTLLQEGYDSNPGGAGVTTSGGLAQMRYAFSDRFFAVTRYEGTNAPSSFARDTVMLLGYRPMHNARITLEDVVQHVPQTTHTLNLQYTVGY